MSKNLALPSDSPLGHLIKTTLKNNESDSKEDFIITTARQLGNNAMLSVRRLVFIMQYYVMSKKLIYFHNVLILVLTKDLHQTAVS